MPILHTDFKFPCHFRKISGKVRDVYIIEEELIVMVATDRISAFDVILPEPIPNKGQILNQISAFFLSETHTICPSYLLRMPDPNVSIGMFCEPIPIEMVVRGYLCGHAWRQYQKGIREICGVHLPDGLVENQKLPEPIITPTTKSNHGHDEDITEREILKSEILSSDEWAMIKHYALALYKFGAEYAEKTGLILVDTKFEFGHRDLQILLIDEILTPDSSRYFIKEGYEERQAKREPQPQYSKEFVRQWLISKGFQGQAGVSPPEMTADWVQTISNRYQTVYETIMEEPLHPRVSEHPLIEMQESIHASLKSLGIF